ncbi:MAG: VanZ family protein [Bacillota bacterium]
MIKKNLPSSKRIKAALLVIYIVLVVYFMFFGFGRLQLDVTHQAYRFQIVPTGIPLWFPKHLQSDILKLWIFSLGNLLVFVPFGILIPMIFIRIKYLKFLLVFLIAIILLEILQMITYLGSFDINDIIVNSIGATIGFLSYKMGNKAKSVPKKIIGTALLVLAFAFIMIAFAEVFNKLF